MILQTVLAIVGSRSFGEMFLEPSGRGIRGVWRPLFLPTWRFLPNAAHVYQSVSTVAKFFRKRCFTGFRPPGVPCRFGLGAKLGPVVYCRPFSLKFWIGGRRSNDLNYWKRCIHAHSHCGCVGPSKCFRS